MSKEKSIEKIGEDIGRRDLADHILHWDKQQNAYALDENGHTIANPDARRCQADKKHGVLQMHGSGAMLICCATKPANCSYSEPVSR